MSNQSLAQRHAAELLKQPPEVLAALRYRWDLWARPDQLAPKWPWTIWVNAGGVGSGKTRAAAEWLRSKIEGSREPITVGLLGRTAKDIRDVMVKGESGIIAVFPDGHPSWYKPSYSCVDFPNGSKAILLSAEKPDAIRGFQFHYAWADEVAEYGDDGIAVENLLLRLRLGIHPQLCITTNPKARHVVPWLFKLTEDEETRKLRNVAVTRSNTFDNAAYLPKSYLDNARALGDSALGRQEIYGEFLDLSGGLFKEAWFKYQPSPPPGLTYVAVDPAVSTKSTSDETGIIVVRRVGKFAYVLDDISGHYSPETWAQKAVEAVRTYGAKAIVAEVSRGHDTIAAVIRQFDKQTPIREVQANRSKDLRAVPVAHLYETGRVFHARKFERLEQQLITFDPATQVANRSRKKAGSPDRMDALVWGITELRFEIGVAPFIPIDARLPTDF